MRTNELDFLTKIIVHTHTQHGGDEMKGREGREVKC